MSFDQILQTAVSQEKFKINDCLSFQQALSDESALWYDAIQKKLTTKQFKAFCKGIVRNCFLIEHVNSDVTSTKMKTRWSEDLDGDVRFASYDTCVRICEKILSKIAALSEEELSVLKEFLDKTVISYEMPIDYVNRKASPIHTVENVDLFLNEDILLCTRMRRFIRDETQNPAVDVFQKILVKKIKVKTYQTDRAQTGDYKTNREKRWEAHPEDVQYALRRECMRIETKLLQQIAMFEGCDQRLIANMQKAGLLPEGFSVLKCPITGDKLQYTEFAHEALHPVQGKSAFQVGHLNPLKSSDTGHTADNISWISEDGNRIQGSLSLDEVNALLKRIYFNRPELQEN